ncbi:MAG TPA: hypothetical protein VH682_19690 [Gemmataceae bacterium]
MNVLMRRFGWVVLTAAVVLGLTSTPVHAQRLPMVPQLNPGFGPAATIAGLGNASVLGRGLVASPFAGLGPLGFGMSNGPLGMMGRPGFGMMGRLGFGGPLGFGSLAASYANSPLGYGSLLNGGLLNNALSGAALGAGYGYGMGMMGTQWMMNPYQGYLSGAASVTNANAKYYLTISQAKLERQKAIQESIKTRKAMMEQAEYEWAHRPDPEKIRQAAIERELDHARHDPSLPEIASGRPLNALLRNLIAQQGQGARGPNVPLSEDNLKSVNTTAGDTRGNVGLLKDNGNLQWPPSLQGEPYKEAREELSRHLKQAYNTVQLNRNPDESTLNDLQADLKKLQETLDTNVSALSPDQFVEARRYVRLLADTITALRDRNVINHLTGAWTPKGKNVAELVQFMRDKGLWFAPAAPGDQSAYTSLYHALAAFDAGMPRTTHTSDSSESGNNARSGGGKEENNGANPR